VRVTHELFALSAPDPEWAERAAVLIAPEVHVIVRDDVTELPDNREGEPSLR
jgi:hypothetical protein